MANVLYSESSRSGAAGHGIPFSSLAKHFTLIGLTSPGGGVLDIFLSGEVRPGPSNPYPV